MSIQPRNDFVFVRESKKNLLSPGGIALVDIETPWQADTANPQKEGVVVAVGPGKLNKKGRRETMWDLEPGQRIAFSPNGTMKQKVGDEELSVIRRDSIYGIVEESHGA